MQVGRHRKYVTLSRSPQNSNDSDGFYEALNPEGWWCSIDPQGPVSDDGRTVSHLIVGRWHAQITMDTRIVYADPVLSRDRQFFVRGFQNVSEQNAEIRLLAEEVVP